MLFEQVEFTAEIWLWDGPAAWHFVTLPEETTEEIMMFEPPLRGFKSVRVEATLGDSIWQTSIFPDSKSGSYLLPIKAKIRSRERLSEGDKVRVTIRPLSI